MSIPLVSVIIPTHNRPHFLPRAVNSALVCQGPDVEVIVVPNGPDESWKESLMPFARDHRVRAAPVATAHANVARNYGLALAVGKYIRFLDDDDYLLPGAMEQVKALEGSKSTMCRGAIEVRTHAGRLLDVRAVPVETRSLVDLVISTGAISLPHAYLYKRSDLDGCQWDETIGIAQDSAWLYSLLLQRELLVDGISARVGTWMHHKGHQTSRGKRKSAQAKIWATDLLRVIRALEDQGRMDPIRRQLAARRLWQITCGAYYTDRRWWQSLVRSTLELDMQSRPNIAVYRHAITSRIPPQLVLDATAPVLRVRRQIRRLLAYAGLYHSAIHE